MLFIIVRNFNTFFGDEWWGHLIDARILPKLEELKTLVCRDIRSVDP